ncbi:MAG: roadblock/LC7 domain-containing protein [Gemmatimonadota bacterium]
MPALRDLISGWTNGESVHGAAIVSEDGLLVHDALDPGTDREAIAALAIELIRNGRQLGMAGARSRLDTVVLDLEHGPAILSPLDASHTLIVFAAGDTDIGALLYEIRTQRAAVSAAI